MGAALLTSDEVHKTFVSEVNRCCLVVEVAFYPAKDKPQAVSLDDFSVRVVGAETAVKPSSAKVVAASIQKSAESQRDITVSPSVGVGRESGTYHGTYTEVGVAIEVCDCDRVWSGDTWKCISHHRQEKGTSRVKRHAAGVLPLPETAWNGLST